MALAALGNLWLAGWLLGEAGQGDARWFYYVFMTPVFSVLLLVPLRARVLVEGEMVTRTDAANWMKLVVYDGNDRGQAWDFIHLFNRKGEELRRLDAGSLGDANGVNYSWWRLTLDQRGYQNLGCMSKQGLDFNAAVATIVSVCVGLPLLAVSGGIAIGCGVLAVLSGGLTLPGLLVAVFNAGAVAAVGTATTATAATATATSTVAVAALIGGLISLGATAGAVIATTIGMVGGVTSVAAGVWVTVAAKGETSFTYKPVSAGDLAQGKPVTASSWASAEFTPDRANDGRTSGSGGWSTAADDGQGWWQVDLGAPTSLELISLVTNQDADDAGSRSHFAVEGIHVGPNGVTSASLLGEVNHEAGPHRGMLLLSVTDPTPFRYIRVRKTAPGPLFITSCQAYARPVDLARGRPAVASSEYSGDYAASRANDGSSAASGGWSPSASDTRSFWQVDLGEPTPLGRIELLTRQEVDQPETRQDFEVWASNHADMSQGHVVLGVRGPRPLEHRETFVVNIDDPTPYRYVAVVKTRPGYFFIGKIAVYGKSAPQGVLRSGDALPPGGSIVSPNGRFKLTYQTDGNLVVVQDDKTALWASQTQGTAPGRVVMQEDGNVVVYDPGSAALWASGFVGGKYGPQYPGSRLAMQDDGNLVVYAANDEVLWQSNTRGVAAAPTPVEGALGAAMAAMLTLASGVLGAGQALSAGGSIVSPNGRFKLTYQTDGNLVVVQDDKTALWNSQTQGTAPGRFVMQEDGNIVVYDASGAALWASGFVGGKYGPQYQGSRLAMQDDGNLVVYAADNTVLWASHTRGG